MKFLEMKCASCGASLQIGPDIDHFSCAYCGTALVVRRSGGAIVLRLVDAIKNVQSGTDRTAAELALVRLKSELAEIDLTLANPSAWPTITIEKLPAGNLIARTVFLVSSFFAVLMVVFLIIIGLSSRPDEGRSALAIQFLIGFVIVAGVSAPKARLGDVPTAMKKQRAQYASQRDEILRKIEQNRNLLNS